MAVGIENESLMITVKADGNPTSLAYTWTKDGLPITQASYSQAGTATITDSSSLLVFRRLPQMCPVLDIDLPQIGPVLDMGLPQMCPVFLYWMSPSIYVVKASNF